MSRNYVMLVGFPILFKSIFLNFANLIDRFSYFYSIELLIHVN